jgi:hypothetical protein
MKRIFFIIKLSSLGPFQNLTYLSGFRMVKTRWLLKTRYSIQPNTGLSGIRMAIFRTLFGSGYQMAAILFLPFENQTEVFLTSSLDYFDIKNILFMTIFFKKRSRLGPTIWKPDLCPVFEWFGRHFVFAIWKLDRKFSASLDRFGMNKIFLMTLTNKTV